jgi:hypothetical protein
VASQYITKVLGVISEFCHNYKPDMSPESFASILCEVSDRFSDQYTSNIKEICESVEKLEQSLKRIRSSKSLKNLEASGSSGDNKPASFLSDSEKMYLQLYLDVEYYSCQMCEYLSGLESAKSMEALLLSIRFASVFKEKAINY